MGLAIVEVHARSDPLTCVLCRSQVPASLYPAAAMRRRDGRGDLSPMLGEMSCSRCGYRAHWCYRAEPVGEEARALCSSLHQHRFNAESIDGACALEVRCVSPSELAVEQEVALAPSPHQGSFWVLHVTSSGYDDYVSTDLFSCVETLSALTDLNRLEAIALMERARLSPHPEPCTFRVLPADTRH